MTIALVSILPLLLVASGVCSAAETAFFSLTHRDRVHLRKFHPAVDARIESLVSVPRALLLTVLAANNVVNVLVFVLGSMVGLLVDSQMLAVLIGIGTVLSVILIGEVLAKVLASKFRVQYCTIFSGLWLAIHTAFRPARIVLNAIIEPMVRVLMPRTRQQSRPAIDVGTLLSSGTDEGVIASYEHTLIERVVAMGTIRAFQAMIPRSVVRWCDANATSNDIKDLVRGTHIDFLPVGQGGIDAGVVGLLDVTTYLHDVETHGSAAIGTHIRPARYVPETVRLDALLSMLHEWDVDLAMVVDEQGVVVGLVRTSDIVRVLVPSANTDQIDEMRRVVTHADGSWSVPGMATEQTWKSVLTQEAATQAFPSDVSTVAGLVMHTLARVPAVDDEVVFDSVSITVEQMFKNTVERVRIRRMEPPRTTDTTEEARHEP